MTWDLYDEDFDSSRLSGCASRFAEAARRFVAIVGGDEKTELERCASEAVDEAASLVRFSDSAKQEVALVGFSYVVESLRHLRNQVVVRANDLVVADSDSADAHSAVDETRAEAYLNQEDGESQAQRTQDSEIIEAREKRATDVEKYEDEQRKMFGLCCQSLLLSLQAISLESDE